MAIIIKAEAIHIKTPSSKRVREVRKEIMLFITMNRNLLSSWFLNDVLSLAQM